MPFSTDTIYALSSGMGKSAVAVVRVSGPDCDAILECLCPGMTFGNREATLAALRDSDRNLIDRALVVRFIAPRSFTGEEMIEFQVTGSRAILACLITILSSFPNVRPAEAGEFARRAFENGKLDLVEIEGLASALDAETQAQLRQAMTMASGALSRTCERVRGLLVRAIAEVEAMLDFSDVEDAEELRLGDTLAIIDEISTALNGLLRHSRVSERLRDGMNVVIAGPPNVGKSTLLNYLARREVAIVSPFPGTTRDSLEVATEMAGFPVTFIDTAGIRETSDALETIGIERSLGHLSRSDLTLWLFDSNSEGEQGPASSSGPIIKVRSKSDLSFEPLDDDVISISVALGGRGVDLLLAKIAEFAGRFFDGAGSVLLGTERQHRIVHEALSAISRVLRDKDMPIELIAEELRFAANAMGRVTGRIGVEEVLGEIFSRLCVGK